MKVIKISSIQPQKQNIRQNSKANVVFEKALSTKKVKTFFIDLYEKIFPYGLSGPRKLPNYISDVNEDFFYTDYKRLEFSLEDELKMAKMNSIERMDYKSKLIDEGKYTIPDDV